MGVLTRWLYFKLLGASALCAIIAYWWQLPGLASSQGLAPVSRTLFHWGDRVSFAQAPTLLWLSSSDGMLHALCAIAAVSALLFIIGLGTRFALFVCWACWLSLVTVGAPFLQFQWDVMLCEALLLSIPYAESGLATPLSEQRAPPYWAAGLVWLIGFKVTFESGLVKLMSGDAAWRDLTALTYHWWSQPLPTWTSYLASLWPMWIQKGLCAVMFALELGAPLLAFGPRPLRRASAVGMIAMQVGLYVAGNYSYFNLLSIAVCVPLLDDELIGRLWPRRLQWFALPRDTRVEAPAHDGPSVLPQPASRDTQLDPPARWQQVAGLSVFVACALLGVGVFLPRLGVEPAPKFLFSAIDPFNSLNAYGAFAVMTKNRAEIIVEGSLDGTEWKAYEFKWKPGRLDVRPQFVAPWQPRLDWQMWFASLGQCQHNQWLLELQRQLMLGNVEVSKLLGADPFDGQRPKMMRTTSFEYRFAPLAQKGVWWTATEVGPYCPDVMLDAAGNLTRAK